MKISKLIERLEQLKAIAGEDVDVAVPIPDTQEFEQAMAVLVDVVPINLDDRWVCQKVGNTHQIIVIQ